ncbi:Chaperonin complex component, TCP-1 delta subunit (CCT4) [Trachipleistophora hominis]|uniref:Chaperonin complex component, TCP-1 delta subunit (CCT4) n=1 Tax=Trachipleistophora hominis TaxID=72359 RepID=L7JW13_TRAHO|nr:Chaperonin complex component, TCP-1 delta subunit (CCT4) [Trachipleistophora hominis]
MKTTDRSKKIYDSNIDCCTSLKSTLSSSIGPFGLDKLLITPSNKIVVTNDGSTILKNLSSFHPITKILNNVSMTQDKVAGDGTTSVVILTAQILENAKELMDENVHASAIIRELGRIKQIVLEYFERSKIRVENFASAVRTSLSSKVVSAAMDELVPLALKATQYEKLKVVKKLGDEIENCTVVDGYCVKIKSDEKNSEVVDEYAIEQLSTALQKKYRVALLQYNLSAPKPNIDSKIEIEEKIEEIIKEEREYVFNLVKKLKMNRVEIALVQKSILKESVSDLAEYFLNKLKIKFFVLEREEIEEISRVFEMRTSSTNNIITYDMNVSFYDDIILLNETETRVEKTCNGENETNVNEKVPVAEKEGRKSEVSGAEGVTKGDASANNHGEKRRKAEKRVGSLIVRASDNILLDETERSLNDAICVARCLKDEPYIVPGGGNVEMNISRLHENEIQKRIMSAFVIIPYFICRNAGLNFYKIGQVADNSGIDCVSGSVENMIEKNIVMPVKVAKSYFGLALETASFILSIDDILPSSQ